jgi:hypothetical protein
MVIRTFIALIVLTVVVSVSSVPSQSTSKDTKDLPPVSAKRGDPPPGDASRFTPGFARFLIRQLVGTRSYWGSTFNPKFVGDTIRISPEGLQFEIQTIAWLSAKPTKGRPVDLVFKNLDYFAYRPEKYSKEQHFAAYWPKNVKVPLDDLFFLWKSETDAKRFSEAINRLIWDAHLGYSDAQAAAEFAANAKTWREKPETRVQPPAAWEKYRVLAEQSVREKDFFKALMNYEAGLGEFPMWPEGWFNAALIYEELKNYADAADRMKHYLELMPSAPDAQAAREKVIIWEDKAKTKEKL